VLGLSEQKSYAVEFLKPRDKLSQKCGVAVMVNMRIDELRALRKKCCRKQHERDSYFAWIVLLLFSGANSKYGLTYAFLQAITWREAD
jgi:hypothetical protein